MSIVTAISQASPFCFLRSVQNLSEWNGQNTQLDLTGTGKLFSLKKEGAQEIPVQQEDKKENDEVKPGSYFTPVSIYGGLY